VKLESTLPTRAGVLHVAPVFDVVLLLLVFFLLGSSFTLRSGVPVRVPESSSVLPPLARAHVVTVTAGGAPKVFLNGEEVTLDELGERLAAMREVSGNVVVRGDVLAGFGKVFEVWNIALNHGYTVAIATSPTRR
jgi:biopolymer transport protein ExbD